MTSHLNSTLKAASAALAVALTVGACAVMEPKAERYVAPAVGSDWVQVQHNTGSYGAKPVQVTVTRGERMWQGKQMITFETPQSTILAYPHGDWVGVFKGEKPLVTWDPPLHWDWPLEVGKTWTHKHRMTIHARKKTIPLQITQKVEAYEDVTVPAGTFKAFKVSSSNTLGVETVMWFSPELGIFVKRSDRRTAKNTQGPGSRETDVIAHTIKR